MAILIIIKLLMNLQRKNTKKWE